MAIVTPTRTQTGTSAAFVSVWANLAQDDTGARIPFSQYTDKSVQVVGAFGGASVRVEGSNDGVNWAVLTDPQGNDLILATAKIEMITEATAFVRPNVTGGSGLTDLSVYMLLKEAR
jgi:hypothetical protein